MKDVKALIETIMLFASGCALSLIIALYFIAEAGLNRSYAVALEPLEIPQGQAAISEGGRLARVRGCFWCHGPGLEGQQYFADAQRGVIVVAPNLTRRIREYSPAEFARTVRHGIKPDGTSLQPAMPSFAFYNMSDSDLGLLMAFIASLPETDGMDGEFRLMPVGWYRWFIGDLPPNVADLIDHNAQRPDASSSGGVVERGRYLSESICTECHGDNGRIRVPGSPDLIVAASYSREDFFTLMRTGKPVGDREIDYHMVDVAKYRYVELTDDELAALYGYFRSLASLPVAY
jgi:mono/diheme cytochrome c family protein